MKNQRVIVYEVRPLINNLDFVDTFQCSAHAEQWILKWAKKDKRFVIFPLYIGGNIVKS